MPVTHNDLEHFHQFASEKLGNGGAESLRQLVSQWEVTREHERSVAAIRESVAEDEAGESVPVEDAFAEIRSRLRWTK